MLTCLPSPISHLELLGLSRTVPVSPPPFWASLHWYLCLAFSHCLEFSSLPLLPSYLLWLSQLGQFIVTNSHLGGTYLKLSACPHQTVFTHLCVPSTPPVHKTMEWFTQLQARGVPILASLWQGDGSIWSSREPALRASSLLQGPPRLLPRPGSQKTWSFHPCAQGVAGGPLCKGQMTAHFNRFQGVAVPEKHLLLLHWLC